MLIVNVSVGVGMSVHKIGPSRKPVYANRLGTKTQKLILNTFYFTIFCHLSITYKSSSALLSKILTHRITEIVISIYSYITHIQTCSLQYFFLISFYQHNKCITHASSIKVHFENTVLSPMIEL